MGHFLRSSLLAAALFLVLFFVFSQFFLILKVEEDSMVPLLTHGQWVLAAKTNRNLARDDLLVFFSPGDGKLAVKRCILVEYDPLVLENGWLNTGDSRWFLSGPQKSYLSQWEKVPPGTVFLVGENQFHSLDSRDYGFVKKVNVVGKVLLSKRRKRKI